MSKLQIYPPNTNRMSNDDLNNISREDLSKYLENIDFGDLNNKVNIKDTKSGGERICTNQSCKSANIIEDYSNGIIVCHDCGQVLDGVMDSNPDWKHFDDDDKTHAVSRCGPPINKLLPQSSLGTSITGYSRSRLRILQSWGAMPYRERSLYNEYKKIHERCIKAKILKCIEEDAKIMYKTISECKHTKGKNVGKFIITRGINRMSIVAACLFYACIRKNMTRTSKEIAALFGITSVEMHRGCKSFLKLLKIRKFNMNMGTSKPHHFVKTHCHQLEIPTKYIDKTLKIVKNIEKLNIVSVHTPFSVAAACILLMAEMYNLRSITKKKVSMNFDISEVTITKTYKKIEQYKKILVNDKLVDKIVAKINIEAKKVETPEGVVTRMKQFGMTMDDVVGGSGRDGINEENLDLKDENLDLEDEDLEFEDDTSISSDDCEYDDDIFSEDNKNKDAEIKTNISRLNEIITELQYVDVDNMSTLAESFHLMKHINRMICG